MGLISGTTILTSLCLFHITLGFFFLTSPSSVADQAMVYVLGESMGLPHVRSFETPSPALAFLGVILFLFGITDLLTLSRDEFEVNEHWGIQCLSSLPPIPRTIILTRMIPHQHQCASPSPSP